MTQTSLDPVRRVIVLVVVVVAVLAVVAAVATSGGPPPPTRGYGEFLADVAAGRVAHVVQVDQELTVAAAQSVYRVVVPSPFTDVYLDMRAAADRGGQRLPADVFAAEVAPDNSWVGLFLTGILPLIVIGGFIYFMMRMAQRGPRPFGLAGRLEQLDEAKRLGKITAEEHAEKRAEILREL